MKKLFAFILTTILILSLSVTVLAEKAIYDTAGDLYYEGWRGDVPDYICAVMSTDGGMANLTFAIQDNELGHAGKQEILDLVKDDSTITFVYHKYTRKYLQQIYDEISTEYYSYKLGIIGLIRDEGNDRVMVGIMTKKKDNPDTLNAMREIADKYGDVVVFYSAEEDILLEAPGDDNHLQVPGDNNSFRMQPQLIFTMGILLIMLVGIFLIFQKRNVLLFQTNRGTIISSPSVPSAKEVEDMVRNKKYDIPSDLDQKVMNEINKIE